jgi:hypothetical protein
MVNEEEGAISGGDERHKVLNAVVLKKPLSKIWAVQKNYSRYAVV